jgi:CheY-like chemotaxis protein
MRVLVCDQESEMLETVARWYAVDTATSKATCVDLMRANPFDVVIASERLSDGSGLELLSHIATRWPDTLRVLVIEPERLRLLRGKLAPFRLDATMRYPIEEEELDGVLNRMSELMGQPEEEPEPPPAPAPPAPPPIVAPKTEKAVSTQRPESTSSVGTRAPGAGAARPEPRAPAAGSRPPATASAAPRLTSRSARASPPLGAPVPPSPPPVRRKLGNYTPLGSPEDKDLRIVERQFDQTVAPLAARAIRSREEASRPRTPKEKLGTLTTLLRDALKKLLRR